VDKTSIINLAYVVSSVLFILGLKNITHPRTAVRGNWLGACGMLLAVVVTLFGRDAYALIALGAVVGSLIGVALAIKIQMTEMPQLVAIFNGFGGLASVLVAGSQIIQTDPTETATIAPWDVLTATAVTGLIGAITFSGSLIAFGKLQELPLFKRSLPIPGNQVVNLVLGAVSIGLAVLLINNGSDTVYLCLVIVASVLGILLVNPIGGADMPVVIALLNSYSGLAASATGFVINNNVLIIAGSLVGASGVILTKIMCKAMNRSLTNVLFGVMDSSSSTEMNDEMYTTVRSTSAEDVAIILESANRVVFVPGYGMAVAQAQHAVRDLANQLASQGTTVEYAIHPVAGRMPGHMNVLLAEADVPYDQLLEMDQVNPTLVQADVGIVIGANDVVNPLARTDPESPIAGMPIIDIDKARTVIVIKRSLSPGFAGIPNPLFAADNTLMLFGDGKKAVLEIVSALKEN